MHPASYGGASNRLDSLRLAAITAVLLCPDMAAACQCPPTIPSGNLSAFTAVFAGIPAEHPATGKPIKFLVQRVWKGPLAKEIIALPESFANSEGCVTEFRTGEGYLIYAVVEGDGSLGLGIPKCSRTRKLSEASAELALLGPGIDPSVAQRRRPSTSELTTIDRFQRIRFPPRREVVIDAEGPSGQWVVIPSYLTIEAQRLTNIHRPARLGEMIVIMLRNGDHASFETSDGTDSDHTELELQSAKSLDGWKPSGVDDVTLTGADRLLSLLDVMRSGGEFSPTKLPVYTAGVESPVHFSLPGGFMGTLSWKPAPLLSSELAQPTSADLSFINEHLRHDRHPDGECPDAVVPPARLSYAKGVLTLTSALADCSDDTRPRRSTVKYRTVQTHYQVAGLDPTAVKPWIRREGDELRSCIIMKCRRDIGVDRDSCATSFVDGRPDRIPFPFIDLTFEPGIAQLLSQAVQRVIGGLQSGRDRASRGSKALPAPSPRTP